SPESRTPPNGDGPAKEKKQGPRARPSRPSDRAWLRRTRGRSLQGWELKNKRRDLERARSERARAFRLREGRSHRCKARGARPFRRVGMWQGAPRGMARRCLRRDTGWLARDHAMGRRTYDFGGAPPEAPKARHRAAGN